MTKPSAQTVYQRLKQVLSSCPLPVTLLQADGHRIVAASPSSGRTHGLRAEELIGKSVKPLFAHLPSRALDLVFDGRIVACELRVRHHNGTSASYWVRGLVLDGKPYALTIRMPGRVPNTGLALAGTEDGGTNLGMREALERLTRELRAEMGQVAPPEVSRRLLNGLAPREREVCVELVRGSRVPAIARALYLSQGTVRNHLSTIFHKLGVANQQELINLLRGQKVLGA